MYCHVEIFYPCMYDKKTKSVDISFLTASPLFPASPIQIPAPSPGLLCWDNEDPNARPLVRTVHCFHKTPIVVPWGPVLHFKPAFSLRAKIYDFTISCNFLPHTPQLFTCLSVGHCRHTVWRLARRKLIRSGRGKILQNTKYLYSTHQDIADQLWYNTDNWVVLGSKQKIKWNEQIVKYKCQDIQC